MTKIALISGITGQDGSLLTDFLLKKNIKLLESKEGHQVLIHKELNIFTIIQNIQKFLHRFMVILLTLVISQG